MVQFVDNLREDNLPSQPTMPGFVGQGWMIVPSVAVILANALLLIEPVGAVVCVNSIVVRLGLRSNT